MSTALMESRPAAVVTADQRDLITRTVAKDATVDELKLYLYDCARQGVHPLDKLIHFTKRSGKYTPITSIDFMRIRAAETGEYAGSDDAVFTVRHDEAPLTATVTVYRLVGGIRCAFTATARWAEYKPDVNAFMWDKMPHTMLAKCAEALALRKGFPRQLAGLYAKEELDQAEALPAATVVDVPRPKAAPPVPALATPGTARVVSVKRFGKKSDQYAIRFTGDDREFVTREAKLAAVCEQVLETDHCVAWTFEDRVTDTKTWHNLKTVTIDPPPIPIDGPPPAAPSIPPPITADDIPF
jgi:phage recombination protein Bet